MTTSELRFYAEYHCHPTWVTLPGAGEDNPDPHTLGIPEDLADEVIAWAEAYDDRFDEDDFTAELFSSDADLHAFDERGRELARRLAKAVGDRYVVRYHSVADPTWVTVS
jgi:hypothetical protein